MRTDIVEQFEKGIADYFTQFGHRIGRELPHQLWLGIALSKFINPQLLNAELHLPKKDLLPDKKAKKKEPAINFDFGVSCEEIDARSWQARTPDHKRVATSPQTIETLKKIEILAEMKIADSKSTTKNSLKISLEDDLQKLLGAVLFLEREGCDTFPACYLIVLAPSRKLDTDKALVSVKEDWPRGAVLPKIIVGP